MFSEELLKYDWDDITRRIHAKTADDVRRALAKSHCDVEDFMALISPAAEPFLEPMAQLSRRYTEERFGRTVSMFIPLYLTNSCTNSCVYCSFHVANKMPRTILTPEEMVREYEAIKRLGPFERKGVPQKIRKDYKARFATKFIIHFYKQNLLSKINLLLCYEIYSLIFYSLLYIFCSISIANLSIYFHIARVLKIFFKKIFLPLFYY